ncbi:hypothetical protein NL676_004880 [Syzygium grande]|nr:hypothetical protein NL676_004880 [Syzygium grande]
MIATSNAGSCRPEVTASAPSVIVDGATGHCHRSVQVSSPIGLGVTADLSHPRPSQSTSIPAFRQRIAFKGQMLEPHLVASLTIATRTNPRSGHALFEIATPKPAPSGSPIESE